VPVDRNWTVPETQQPEISEDPEGNLLITPRVVRDDDPDALVEAVLEVVAIQRRIGGTVQIASQRAEIAPNVVITESYIFAFNSFTPLVRRLPRDEPQQEGAEPLTVEEREANEDVHLDERELEMHFPEESPLADLVEQAQAEEPAEPEPAAAVE
jgi:hypothetical protein